MEGHQQPMKVANAPFNDPAADLVLRSTDNVDFHIHSVILRLSSSHFAFLPDNQHAGDSLAAAVSSKTPQPFPETSVVLDRMLRFCYPGADPVIEFLDELCEVINAMIRHSMEESNVLRRPGLLLLNPCFLEKVPLRVFAIAYRSGWRDIAEEAAKASLKLPLTSLYCDPIPDELTFVSSILVTHFFAYRNRCCIAASDAAWQFCQEDYNHKMGAWRDGGDIIFCGEHEGIMHPERPPIDRFHLSRDVPDDIWDSYDVGYSDHTYLWFWEFSRAAAHLLKDLPGVIWTASMESIFDRYKSIALKCSQCHEIAHFMDSRHFEATIKEAIAGVPLNIFD